MYIPENAELSLDGGLDEDPGSEVSRRNGTPAVVVADG